MSLAAAQTLAQSWDGYTTVRGVESGGHEADPLARIFIGRYPTWGSMAPAGTMQIVGTAWIAEKMRRSHNRIVRKVWFVPQAASIAVSAGFARNNQRCCR